MGCNRPLHAFTVASACGVSGLWLLQHGVNGVCASLGALTLVLYTCVYTPMKRVSIANTWVGAVGTALPLFTRFQQTTFWLSNDE